MSVVDYGVIVLYLIGMVAIGMFASKKIHKSSDFSLGGRTLSPFVITCSAIATCAGAGTCMAYAGKAYNEGFSSMWIVITWVIGMLVLMLMAQRIYETGAESIPTVFGSVHGIYAERFAAIFASVYCMSMLVSQMIGIGTVLQLVLLDLNIDYQTAVLVGGAITILYTLQGGFFAVAYTDTIQMIILGVAMMVIFPFAVLTGAADASLELVETMITPGTFSMWEGVSAISLLAIVCKYTFSACTGIPYIQRILASRNAKEARNSQGMAAIGYLVLACSVMMVAVFTRLLYPEIENPDTVVLYVIMDRFPTVLAGLGIAGLVAAVMSSVDSYLLVISQMFCKTIIPWAKPDVTEEQEFKLHRIVTFVFGVGTIVIALGFNSIQTVFEYGASVYSSAIFFPFVLSLYWKKCTASGAVAGMIAGGVTYLSLSFLSIAGIDMVIVGNLVSLAAVLIVSLATGNKAKQMA